ncbi:MAG: DUF3598 family protein [Cyanobacteria bacterium P01_H01_bin.21]
MQFSSVSTLWTTDQWGYIRKNIGEWQGAFIQFSPEANPIAETPSMLTLEEDSLDQHMTLTLTRTPEGKSPSTVRRELAYPGAAPYICFFPTGAFSQGATYRRPWSSFGAEFSLLSENRRMRLVQLYNGTASGEHTLDYVTLIPEYRSPEATTPGGVTDCLDVDNLLGTWKGEYLYLSATMDSPRVGDSYCQTERSTDGSVLKTTVQSWGQQAEQRFVQVDRHRWQAVDQSLQLWLLPGGVSCMVYPQLPQQQSAQLEFCWHVSSHQRQRVMRDYDADGGWVGTSLILETRE